MSTRQPGDPTRTSRQTVWLTGASSGIGKALCNDLLAQGFTVVSFALEAPPIDHKALHAYEVDLSDTAATRQAVADAASAHPATRIVHNAGAIREKLLKDVVDDDLDTLTHLHLGAAITLMQGALPAMQAEQFGRIVLLSTRAVLGLEKRTVYAATKAGLIGMGRTWALEYAAYGITVNMVAPGPIAGTAMFHDVVPEDSPQLPVIAARVPVKRLGTPADVSRAVQFFLDDAAGFVTGQTLFVCGGASVGSMSFS